MELYALELFDFDFLCDFEGFESSLFLSFDFSFELQDGLRSEFVDVALRDTVLEDLALEILRVLEIK